MDNTIPMQEWARFLGEEYLESFIQAGGSSVKFAVTDEERIPELQSALAAESQKLGCVFVKIDAVTARVHMPQDIFFSICRQLDWRLLARRVIVKLADGELYETGSVDPSADGNIYAAIGKANQMDARDVLLPIRVAIQNRVFRERAMARDFRVAMTHMCLIEAPSGSKTYDGQPLIDWLTGVNSRISNVRHFSIHTPINRTTARHFMESAFYWIRYAGYNGIVVFIDDTRITLPRNPRDGLRFYTKAMVIDHYELLREMIDSADRLSGALGGSSRQP